jgi:hypothetical protein
MHDHRVWGSAGEKQKQKKKEKTFQSLKNCFLFVFFAKDFLYWMTFFCLGSTGISIFTRWKKKKQKESNFAQISLEWSSLKRIPFACIRST